MLEKILMPILTFLKEIGLKTGGLVTLGGIGSLFALEWYDKLSVESAVSITIITIVFIGFRTFSKTKQNGDISK